MKFGLHAPTVEPHDLIRLAEAAEESGWDGLFPWDLIWGINVWVSLAAAAVKTERLRLGPIITPLSRRRPWAVASEVMTLDRLSHGRAVLMVGLGAALEAPPHDWFARVGEVTDRKTRAEMVDESLDIIDGLWQGQPFSYEGQHYHLRDVDFTPTPVQQPRVPIWCVGAWPRPKSMQRVLRCDGILPAVMKPEGGFADITPDDIRAIQAYVDERRTLTTPFDIVMEGETPGDDQAAAAAQVRPFAEAGVTWWLENIWATPMQEGGVEGMLRRIRQGPPRL